MRLVARVVRPVKGRCTLRLCRHRRARCERYRCSGLRRDSTLEAFSHNPTDGSFAPLVTRQAHVPRAGTCGLRTRAGLLSQRPAISRVSPSYVRPTSP
ncbi:hypothetical protein CEXT_430681 [Caerostris extrusa]|uniref:Uncharacterized protein n=1 Tax=Caerostris extrusa TaxID=172846 RepID=A0AAV4UUJ7_CAEEX|nr:hypothetical protein CEXT_430681 [Caerostris extrusa]